jgi:hypothetical protein
MSTISHEPPTEVPERPRWSSKLIVREMWAALAIAVMWLAVLFAALFGPNLVSTSAGANSTTVPSGVAVAFFATVATWAVAKHGFGDRHRDP